MSTNARKELRRLAFALEQEAYALTRAARAAQDRASVCRQVASRWRTHAEAEKFLAQQPEVVNKLHPFEAKS